MSFQIRWHMQMIKHNHSICHLYCLTCPTFGALHIQLFSLARTLLAEPDLIKKWKKNSSYVPKCIARLPEVDGIFLLQRWLFPERGGLHITAIIPQFLLLFSRF